MSGRVTIAKLEERVRWQADIDEAEIRHTSVALREQINQSIHRYRALVSGNGAPYFLKPRSGSLEVGRATSSYDPEVKYDWGVLDMTSWNPEVVQVYGVELHHNGKPYSLSPISFTDRNEYSDTYGVSGVPQKFMIYDESLMALLPAPNAAYKYTVWYLPKLPPLMADGDEFNPGYPGGEQWIVWDCFIKLISRDDYPGQAQAGMVERDKYEKEIMSEMERLQRSGPNSKKNLKDRAATLPLRLRWPR